MEDSRSKRTAETNREKQKRKNDQEKKTKSETTTFSTGSSLTDPSLDSIIVVGKGCSYGRSKRQESGYRLHECYSEAAINLVPESSNNLMDLVRVEGLHPVASNSSFLSAKSDFSDAFQKRVHELEDELHHQNLVIHFLKKQMQQKDTVAVTTVSTETDMSLDDTESKLKLKELEKKINSKEKKIRDLNQRIEDSSKARDVQNRENKRLSHQVNLLNRQLKSMFELIATKNWNNSVDPAELTKYKNKVAELEALVVSKEGEKSELSRKIETLSESLESRERELSAKSQEFIEYKNRSTLEMCKLVTQVDNLQKEAKSQSELLESKIAEAQNSMDDEIVNITQKLEDQYQKDMKSAIEKFHSDFERLSELPRTAIEKLLQFCEPEKMDLVAFQKEWDKQQSMLEAKIEAMHADRNTEITQLKDSYESKVMFLKTQVEALTSQLKERKEIIDVFETELKKYKSNSSMNLLKASSLGDDISSLKELYTAEIFSQKQVHKLQVDIFEEKVKTLTEEILYHAKNEEIHLQEVENARKMAFAFREKYEQLVFEWEERVEKELKMEPAETEITPELDNMMSEFKKLIGSLRKSEEAYEERIKMLETENEDEKFSLLRDIENFKTKLREMQKFQKSQAKLDETMHDLIRTVGVSYTKTVEALLLSQVTELSLKQTEMCASEKRHIEEIDALKNDHEKELEELRRKVKFLEESRQGSKSDRDEDLEAFRKKTEDLSAECIKMEGMMAIKEETEKTLNERIKELEDVIKLKEENCQKKLEELTANYLKVEVLSSAKDDLVRELEERLNESEKLLEKSCEKVDHLTETCSLVAESTTAEKSAEDDREGLRGRGDEFEGAKSKGERLKMKLMEILERVEFLEEMNRVKERSGPTEDEDLSRSLSLATEKNTALEEEKKKMKEEMSKLVEKMGKTEKALAEMDSHNKELSELKEKLKELENEKNEILLREKLATDEKQEILERNQLLEDKIRDLNTRVDMLIEFADNRRVGEEEIFSISLKEVRVLYEEEQQVEVEQSASLSGICCRETRSRDEMYSMLWRTNDELRKENETLKSELREREVNIQKELSDVTKERDGLMAAYDNLKEEVENLRVENYAMKVIAEKGADAEEPEVAEMNRKVGKLSEYVRTLTSKLDVMKASNELLVSESHEHLRHNQNLVNELEEAWSQRYEIEDQLAKMRKENYLLHQHRKQLEESNRSISNLLTEGKPSVVSWIKIHETVESIVDEVLALKTSFSDSGSTPGASAALDVTRTTSELKMMTETLHAQLKNKTMLCDELIIQKETLERELRNLEVLMREDRGRCANQGKLGEPSNSNSNSCSNKKRRLDPPSRQPGACSSEKRLTLDDVMGYENKEPAVQISSSSFHLSTLNKLKKDLVDQVELEKAQFREGLKIEIRELTKEMAKVEGNESDRSGPSGDGEECLKAIEAQYEKEVTELTKEFEAEVEKLKEAFAPEKEGDGFADGYAEKIDSLKSYFERKWSDLEKRYTEACCAQKQKRLNTASIPESKHILEQFKRILHEENGEEERKAKLESFLKEMVNRHVAEVRSLREKYEEAVTLLEERHVSEVQKLHSVVLQLKDNVLLALKRDEGGGREPPPEEPDQQRDDLIRSIRTEYEAKLQEEKKRLCDSLEEAREKHEREILALEEFWTEKLSECETRCALMKATRKTKAKTQGESEESFNEGETENRKTDSEIDQSYSERSEAGERQVVQYSGEREEFGANSYPSGLRIKKGNPEDGICVYCPSNRSIFGKMEVKTDDDKLDVMLQRETLQEMVASMRTIITGLLTYIGQHGRDSFNSSFEDTMYRSIHVDLDRTICDTSEAADSAPAAMDLSSVFQGIKDNSLLNSSDQVRFELDRCLQQLKKDANCLLALSCPENSSQTLSELIRRVEREKGELEAKVMKVEEMQEVMKKEINATKDRLSQWERNLEVVSEGYGEEIVEPKQIISLSDLKDKLKMYLTEHCGQSSLDVNLLDEICKEGDRLQEEWKKEKCDLQQQIDVADKQVHSLKKFLEEQAVEREQEREAFDREISRLEESLKAKERDNSVQNRTNREVEALEVQLKELTARLGEMEKNKGIVEGEFQNAVKKIWSLREVIQDLEVQLAEVSERESNLKKKLDVSEAHIEELSKANRSFKEEVEASRNQDHVQRSEHVKALEEELMKLRHVADQVNPDSLMQLKANLREIEAVLIKKTKDLEQLHVSSANVSCSSPSEDISIRDHLDATRCSTPDEMSTNVQPLDITLPMEEVDRIHEKLGRHSRAEEVAMKYIRDLKMQLRNHRKAFEEVQTERDVLLEKVDLYLKENSGLKVRLEEQRCNAGLLQKQLNANLESQVNRLEFDVEKLNELCSEKDKQLRDLKEILENTTKSLKVRETEALNKSKEENTLITTLKTDLANALNENGKLEEKLEKTMEKLRETLKMPALIDSMLDEKNAEIDRLEKEVERLSREKTSSTGTPRSHRTEEKHKRRIRFSEPESFSGNISSISVHCPSEIRNCSDSSADFRNSSFRTRRPIGYSTKLESNSSIAPLQLSPRGADFPFSWKTSSPVCCSDSPTKSPPKTSPTKGDLQQMEEMSKLQAEMESKQREISELHLEIDILKRQLVEVGQEVATAKSQTKEIQNELLTKDEDIRKLKNNEKSLLLTVESLKANHAEEVDELQSKLRFEHGKVEKVYDEIKALEVKKIEIEESFLSLREDYSEKINAERKTAEALSEQIRALEGKNEESEIRLAALEREMETKNRDAEKTIETLTKEIAHLRSENEKIRSEAGDKANAETQVEQEACVCQKSLALETPKGEAGEASFRENLDELKAEFEKMAAAIGEKDFNRTEAFAYAVAVRRLFSVVLAKVEELSKELESQMKKVMECSVDDLAIKVQKELVLSAKLDNELLSSIEANGFGSKEETAQAECQEGTGKSYKEVGGGDNEFVVPKAVENVAMVKAVGVCEELRRKMAEMEKERKNVEGKMAEQQKIIRALEQSLKQERARVLEEKERCIEDAKIMELLRVNLEKGLKDIRVKDRELKKEKQQKMLLEKEIESHRKHETKSWDAIKVLELNMQLTSQKEKIASMSKLLEEEKKKNKELEWSLEEIKIERMTDQNAQKLLENDLALLREQKQNVKAELIRARKLLHCRDLEIGLLKRRINLQEIDIKALALFGKGRQNPSDLSCNSNGESLIDLLATENTPASVLFKLKKLNPCIQSHLSECSETDEIRARINADAEEIKEIIKKLEERNDTKATEETVFSGTEIDRKLWALEKERLAMDLETVERENEALKRNLIETCASNDSLKQENAKMKKEMKEVRPPPQAPKEKTPNWLDDQFHQERIARLTRKYMRTESHRKALAWQKNYLMITLKEYQRSEETLKKMGRKKKEVRRKVQKGGKFRVVALAVLAIFRMRFIVKRWKRGAMSSALPLLPQQPYQLSVSSFPSVLDIFNNPVDPLSYQTQNICHPSSSHILRTPPCRDPGPRSFSSKPKNVPESLEYLQDNVDIMNALPCILECLNE